MPESLTALGAAVAALLKQRKQTLAVAESSAGGLINAALVAVPGASAYYLGGCIVYTGARRSGFLSITSEMKGMRSASEPYAKLVARRVRENPGATWGLCETGAAGPSGNRYGDAAGHACLAVSGPVEAAITLETRSADREANMWTFARRALQLFESCLRN